MTNELNVPAVLGPVERMVRPGAEAHGPKQRAAFAAVCAMLPEGFEWGDPLTVAMARSIVAAAMAAERERCAKACEQEATYWPEQRDFRLCAARIRNGA